MFIASLMLLLQTEQTFQPPSYFTPVFLILLGAGAIAWLVAAILGFTRSRTYGAMKWFSLAAVCMLLYHLQFLLIAVAVAQNNSDLVLSVGAFFNLMIVLAAVCAIIGFVRFTDMD